MILNDGRKASRYQMSNAQLPELPELPKLSELPELLVLCTLNSELKINQIESP